jgi:enamine deaminase RidA (YjgF/YER057c/UK114 family)
VIRRHVPDDVSPPFGSYAHGVEIDGPARWLFGAGQVGVDAEGRLGEGITEQARLVWRNIERVLASAEMGIGDIVQLTMYLTDRTDRAKARRARDEALGDQRPASTLLFVSGLSDPAWRIEIDFVAATPSR